MNEEPDQLNAEPPQAPIPVNHIAGRLKRFIAAMIDGLIGMLVSLPIFNHFGVWEALKNQQEIPASISYGLAAFGVIMFFSLHGYLLFHFGQTIGKRIIGLAIVTLTNEKPSFAALIVNRYLPQWVVGFIPGLGPLLALADVIYIFFNDQHRCLHDLIGKTKVIDLSVKVSVAPNSLVA